jgi:hypothetical protein
MLLLNICLKSDSWLSCYLCALCLQLAVCMLSLLTHCVGLFVCLCPSVCDLTVTNMIMLSAQWLGSGLDNRGYVVRFPLGAREFSCFPICPDRFEVYPTSWAIGDLRGVRRLKRVADRSLSSIAKQQFFELYRLSPWRCTMEQLSVQWTVAVFIAVSWQAAAVGCCISAEGGPAGGF